MKTDIFKTFRSGRSHSLYKLLVGAVVHQTGSVGFENVFIFEGGYPHWIEKNLPIKRFCSEKPTNNSINSECIYENE